jgi:hypothetical protein
VTNPALAGEPRADGGCRVCGTKLPTSLVCEKCGAVHGERWRCPHCGAVADVEPSKRLRWRCKVCGGPRVPSDDAAVVRSGAETPALERAQRAERVAAAWRVAAGVVAGFGSLSLVVALLVLAVVTPGVLGTLGASFAVLVPFVLAWILWRRGNAEAMKIGDALDEAWQHVAREVLEAHGGELTAAELARTMRADAATAEHLMARLGAHDAVRTRVTETGDVVYSSHAGERVRVDAPTVAATELGLGRDPHTVDGTELPLDEAEPAVRRGRTEPTR